MLKMAENNQLRIGAVLSYLNILLSIGIGFVTAPLLINNLGKSEYGAYQMTAALIGYISVLDLGLHNAVTRYVARYLAIKDKRSEENFLAISLGIFGIIGILILTVVGIIYVNVASIYRSSATAEEIEIIKKLLLVMGINLAISMPGAVFSSIITAYEKFIFSRSCATTKLIARFGLLLVVMSMGGKSLNQINWKADTTILGIMIGTTAVTLYSIAGSLISYYRSFSGAISGIFLPKATKMTAAGANNSELTDLMITVGRIQLVIIGLILSGFVVIGKEFISLWVGAEYIQAYYWFLIMALPLLIPMTQSIGINILEAKFKHKFRALVYLGIAIANIALTILLVRINGITGAAIATGLAMFIGNNVIINIYYSNVIRLEIGRFFKEVYMKTLPIQLIITVALMVVDKIVSISGQWIDLIIKGVIVCTVYCGVIYLFVLTDKEKQYIKLNR